VGDDGKVHIVAKVTNDLVAQGAHAGKLVREIATACGGGGGGKPTFAQAGGRDAAKLDEALALAERILAKQLGV
jgi:alanyl-tRNA synthetase